MAKTYVYDPEKIMLQINNIYLTGFAEDGKFVLEQNEDDVLPKVGVDGLVHYAINYDKTAILRIQLMSTSPQIPYLRQLARNNQEFNVTMVDLNENGENFSSDDCRIIKTPDYTRQKENENVEIEIFVPYLK